MQNYPAFESRWKTLGHLSNDSGFSQPVIEIENAVSDFVSTYLPPFVTLKSICLDFRKRSIIKYLSFEDTITACKKCAYHFDIKSMVLCPKCKVYYKGIQYPTCIKCLPEEKRKAALEKIEFGKKWQAMHEKLGID